MKKLVISLIAIVVVLSMAVACFAGCDTTPTTTTNNNGNGNGDVDISGRVDFTSKIGGAASGSGINVVLDNTLVDEITHEDDDYFEIYESVLGDYYTAMVAAQAQTDPDAKYAAYAIAEAKLLEAAVYMPTTSKGGQYAISKVVPGTISPIGWGMDQERYHDALVATTYIKAADREEMKVKYKELKGTGTYLTWAKDYLASKGYTLKDKYIKAYNTDPVTWDITNTYLASDSEAIVNTFDGLIEYDVEGRMMGHLATDLKVSEDGLKYTFTIREGVYWVDQDGNDRYEVTAQDWVDGMRHTLENDYTGYLVQGIIKNATEYAYGDTDDFSEVGVKATGKYTLEYTLEAPCTYFLTMFNYNPFAPVCQKYIDEVGDDYATGPDKILYCGPYICTNFTAKNKLVFEANPKYWNKDAINIKTIEWKSYEDNKDATATYNDLKVGTIDGCNLNTSTIALVATDNLSDYVYVSGTDCTAYGFFFNVNRQAFETMRGNGMASTQSEGDKARVKAAMQNANFRMALARGINRASYNAIEVGEDCKLYSLANMYTPGNFVQLSKAVTIAINGQNTTFAKGTYYGAMVQAQINADMGEKAIKVWDPTKEGGAGSSAGFDGWYDADIANEYLNAAIQELAAKGIEVSAQNPIKIDYPCYDYDIYKTRSAALKQQIETLFGGKVVLTLVETQKELAWLYAGYYTGNSTQCNYDTYDVNGWGPDYGDPATYLNTMMPVSGDMIKMIGLY